MEHSSESFDPPAHSRHGRHRPSLRHVRPAQPARRASDCVSAAKRAPLRAVVGWGRGRVNFSSAPDLSAPRSSSQPARCGSALAERCAVGAKRGASARAQIPFSTPRRRCCGRPRRSPRCRWQMRAQETFPRPLLHPTAALPPGGARAAQTAKCNQRSQGNLNEAPFVLGRIYGGPERTLPNKAPLATELYRS